jgi:opacity protein-like surface antigen
MMLGAEIDYNTSSGDISEDEEFVETDLATLAHLKLRAGANVGNAFIYGTAGMAYADISITAFGLTTEMADTAPFYGVGADMMVFDSISIGAEYLIHSFEDMDGTGYDVEFNTAMVRASYHF